MSTYLYILQNHTDGDIVGIIRNNYRFRDNILEALKDHYDLNDVEIESMDEQTNSWEILHLKAKIDYPDQQFTLSPTWIYQ